MDKTTSRDPDDRHPYTMEKWRHYTYNPEGTHYKQKRRWLSLDEVTVCEGIAHDADFMPDDLPRMIDKHAKKLGIKPTHDMMDAIMSRAVFFNCVY